MMLIAAIINMSVVHSMYLHFHKLL